MVDRTLQPDSEEDLWSLHARAATPELHPRMVLLYHAELSRIGALTRPEVLAGGEWVEVGRSGPDFEAPTPSVVGGPMDDPYISRRQLKVRWDAEAGRFQVAPLAEGRRALVKVDLGSSSLEDGLEAIEAPRWVEPGTVLALGSRVLLLLELAPWHGPEDARLGMVGESLEAWSLRDAITRAARLKTPVLILGPTGTGKERVSRAVHALRSGEEAPFVPVNCAAVPEHLAESLFFGHKKGAFTGADADQDGHFIRASGGTLFLDELCELPASIQAKLLRVIQERTLTPVGGRKPIPASASLVAATNRDVEVEMGAGRLRPDFYFRLSTHTLRVPSLDARIFDVPSLFVHFLTLRRGEHPELEAMWQEAPRKPPVPIAFFLGLLRRSWRGNIRELQNLVEQTVRENLHGGPFVVPSALLEEAAASQPTGAASAPSSVPAAPTEPVIDRDAQIELGAALGVARKTLERLLQLRHIDAQRPDEDAAAFARRVEAELVITLERYYEAQDSNQVHAAAGLEMSRTTFIRLMKRFGLKD